MSEGPEDLSLRLVRLIQQGIDREENFRQLVELHRARVHNFFRRKGFSQEESLDLTQDVFLRVFKAIDTFRGDSSFEWWLMEVADSVYKNELRRRGAGKRAAAVEQSLDQPVSNDSAETLGDSVPAKAPSQLAVMERKEQEERVRAAMRDLPPQMRLVVQLRYEKGLKYQEIADLLGISIETVKAHLFQARKRLMAEVAGETSKNEKGKV
ncbi:MAG TPA: sigma-70 family RNA polymerase sigma factor [Thermoanaerobaculia bacterium]